MVCQQRSCSRPRTGTVCQQTACLLLQSSGGVCLPLVHMAGLAIVQSMTLHAGTAKHG